MSFNNRPMRRSALIGPWGVGAVVPFPNDESLMIAGLDMWRYSDATPFVIEDERLLRRLGVKELRWPPDYREKNEDRNNCYLTIPTVRFPTWHYCPFCGTMEKTTLYQQQPVCECYPWPNGRKCNPSFRHKRRLIPERFIIICPDGHVDDFPVAEWLHQKPGYKYNPATCKIRRSTGGSSASLSGVYYECSCGAKESIAGATKPGALSRIGYKCRASKPWLGMESDDDHPCENSDVRVVLRGATNVWYADTRSSIFIPTDDDHTQKKILAILDEYYDVLSAARIDGEWNRVPIDRLAERNHVDPNELYQAFLRREQGMDVILTVSEEMTEDEYRLAEYKVLVKSCGNDGQPFHSKNYPISWYDPVISKYFKSVSLVHKLQETRAFIGFSRVEPKELPISERKKMLRLGNENWLPAIQVKGEGIFFEFNKDALEEWAKRPAVLRRIKTLQDSYKNSKFGANAGGELRPEFLLIHTFAHLLINQLSFECGYGSSSIRERIYCEKATNEHGMYGVLIYTASGDSEGSLGGLVRQGERKRIEDTIRDAVRNATWCSADPVCIQSLGQGPESCNLAACHNCALLPETCCECGNRLLDRGVVVGDLEDKTIGFFSELCNQ
ncbi:MAG: DUF1998 domain-containing protein [Clostridia bacterium]|nr:DUF1998 domain-containing protein [Clostridia bacterium]